jgi:hypothetical protein
VKTLCISKECAHPFIHKLIAIILYLQLCKVLTPFRKMHLKETEKIYLDNNSKYYIEQMLLSSFSINELSDFIMPLYKEYVKLDKNIKKEIKITKKKYNNLNELSEYFIELLVKQEHG